MNVNGKAVVVTGSIVLFGGERALICGNPTVSIDVDATGSPSGDVNVTASPEGFVARVTPLMGVGAKLGWVDFQSNGKPYSLRIVTTGGGDSEKGIFTTINYTLVED